MKRPIKTPEEQRDEVLAFVDDVLRTRQVGSSQPASGDSQVAATPLPPAPPEPEPAKDSDQAASQFLNQLVSSDGSKPRAAVPPPPQAPQQMPQQALPQALPQVSQQQPENPPSPQTNERQAAPQATTIDKVLQMLSDRVMKDQATPEEKATQGQWAQLEKQKLTQLTGGGDTAQDWAVGLGTAIPMLAGTLMQTASPQRSRGLYGVPMESGLGKIAEAGIQGANNLMQERQHREQANAALAQQAATIRKGYQDKDFDRLSKLGTMLSERDRISIAMQNMGFRGTETALKQAAQDFRLNPTNEQATALKRLLIAGGADPSQIGSMGTAALQQVAHQINQQTDDAHFGTELQQAGSKSSVTAAAGENARSGAQAANAPRDAETKRQLELGGGVGSAQAKIGTAQDVNDATGETQKSFAAATDKFYNDMGPTLNSMGAIQKIMRQKPNGGEIPGLTRKDRLVAKAGGGFLLSDRAQAVTQMADRVIEMYSRDQSGAAIASTEAAKFLKQVMGDPNASGADVEKALDRFYIVQGDMVRGRSTGNPEAAQAVVDNMGLTFNVLNSKVRQSRAAKAPNQPAAGSPKGSGGLSDLVTGGSGPKPRSKSSSRPTLGDFD